MTASGTSGVRPSRSVAGPAGTLLVLPRPAEGRGRGHREAVDLEPPAAGGGVGGEDGARGHRPAVGAPAGGAGQHRPPAGHVLGRGPPGRPPGGGGQRPGPFGPLGEACRVLEDHQPPDAGRHLGQVGLLVQGRHEAGGRRHRRRCLDAGDLGGERLDHHHVAHGGGGEQPAQVGGEAPLGHGARRRPRSAAGPGEAGAHSVAGVGGGDLGGGVGQPGRDRPGPDGQGPGVAQPQHPGAPGRQAPDPAARRGPGRSRCRPGPTGRPRRRPPPATGPPPRPPGRARWPPGASRSGSRPGRPRRTATPSPTPAATAVAAGASSTSIEGAKLRRPALGHGQGQEPGEDGHRREPAGPGQAGLAPDEQRQDGGGDQQPAEGAGAGRAHGEAEQVAPRRGRGRRRRPGRRPTRRSGRRAACPPPRARRARRPPRWPRRPRPAPARSPATRPPGPSPP